MHLIRHLSFHPDDWALYIARSKIYDSTANYRFQVLAYNYNQMNRITE